MLVFLASTVAGCVFLLTLYTLGVARRVWLLEQKREHLRHPRNPFESTEANGFDDDFYGGGNQW